jgi:V/A-type H+-transporting ATPase subunit D
MELLRVRKRLGLAVRGHKLLKDKLEGLVKEVTERLDELKKLRLGVDADFPEIIQLFVKAGATATPQGTETAAAQAYPGAVLRVGQDRIMGVPVPTVELTMSSDTQAYNLTETSPYLDAAIRRLVGIFPRIARLAQLEDTIRRIADELERTRRRTNALEYSVIPDLRDTRRTIEARLEEYARSDISRLMKVKEMLLERDRT